MPAASTTSRLITHLPRLCLPTTADNMPIAREELYGMYEGNGHCCSPKCCTKEVKKGCQKDDLCIATGCCGMAPCCFVQYFKAGCFGDDI